MDIAVVQCAGVAVAGYVTVGDMDEVYWRGRKTELVSGSDSDNDDADPRFC